MKRRSVLQLLALVLAAGSCGDDGKVAAPKDIIAPAAVDDLVLGGAHAESISLLWTATGDDGYAGRAAVYDIRYSAGPISETNWQNATQAAGEPEPDDPRFPDHFTVQGLSPSTEYYFAIKVGDETPNWSTLSNVSHMTTAPPVDEVRPSQIADLTAVGPTPFSIDLTWTAPGDDGSRGQASRYDIRYSIYPIVFESDWNASSPLVGLPLPAAAGTLERLTVGNLVPRTSYHFAIKSADEAFNWSIISNTAFGQTLEAEHLPPAAVVDLHFGQVGYYEVELVWSATGDDGHEGTASRYEIRYSNGPLSESNWNSAIRLAGEPAPALNGSADRFTVSNLRSATRYYFALKVGDEVPNWSAISNVVDTMTAEEPDITPPQAVSDLTVVAATSNTITMRWLATGDDGASGLAAGYDVRYAQSTFTESQWGSLLQAPNEPTPGPPAFLHLFAVGGLKPNTTYYFAIRVVDEAGNWSSISNIASGKTSN